jgi:hypothetical protein
MELSASKSGNPISINIIMSKEHGEVPGLAREKSALLLEIMHICKSPIYQL